jgi:hypothetical protein
MNAAEWEIVTRVYGDTLPYRWRIFLTDALAMDDRAFTIPTSLLSTLPAAITATLTGGLLAGPAGALFGAELAAGAGWIGSRINLGYVMGVGPDGYAGMDGRNERLLVHETAHAWQGRNSTFALSYVFGSVRSQCRAWLTKGSFNRAYDYEPGARWGSYNPEQQAHLIEDWFGNGESTADERWPYIRDYVREGKTASPIRPVQRHWR